jgi:hypothetical protein
MHNAMMPLEILEIIREINGNEKADRIVSTDKVLFVQYNLNYFFHFIL